MVPTAASLPVPRSREEVLEDWTSQVVERVEALFRDHNMEVEKASRKRKGDDRDEPSEV